jgi:hypothetical protein
VQRIKDEQPYVSPSARARDIVTCLIARHGLLQAVDIGHCIEAQLGAAVEQQKRLHPEDKGLPLRPAQPARTAPPAVPAVPKILG